MRIVTSSDTSYRDGYARGKVDYADAALRAVSRALRSDSDSLFERHVTDVRSYFDRVSISLGERDRSHVPTAERIRTFVNDEGIDTDLITLAFHYGRYLTIAASRVGSLATNLQGIWNEEAAPPWNANYTVNINTEMNYWHTSACDLIDLCEPLESLCHLLHRQGQRSAAALFDAGARVPAITPIPSVL